MNMSDRVTYTQLDAVLSQLGFRKSAGPASHVVYRHDATETRLLFPKHRARDWVPSASIVGMRKLLVDRGVVAAEQLEEMLLAAAA